MIPFHAVPDRLEKHRLALVVIDIQERFRNLLYDQARLIRNTSRLVRAFRELDLPILVTEHYSKGLGATMSEIRGLLGGLQPLEKITFSCDGDPGFRRAFDGLNRDQVVLCGIESHICVYQTARDLMDRGRQVAIAADAVTSRNAADREIALGHLRRIGVQVMNVEMILFEILREAKTADFQRIAPLLKGD
ncbi:MAG TPA: hydrolase [Candidatus Krumholzibacteria bacterium]|nr:hydrolase [Candidatus Krumholzibacteria bacterium]HPD72376.1 hydrolase [Candidatus Krumholzibacteria bacterium]HRY40692.1 hydrolase [Candidatus Krumholzibacteria bacterium]